MIYSFWLCESIIIGLAEFYSLEGKIDLRRQRIWVESSIVSHLDCLRISIVEYASRQNVLAVSNMYEVVRFCCQIFKIQARAGILRGAV